MEIIKNPSTILMLLNCACFSYQVVYPALSLVQPVAHHEAISVSKL